jgi:trehalose 6-phosphate phosphatase
VKAGGAPPAGLLDPLRLEPEKTGVFTDFDGTVSDIVPVPGDARPLPGVVDVLHHLAGRYARVAVVSGRPASFLAAQLDLAGRRSGLLAVGMYGMEETDGSGPVSVRPGLEEWRSKVAEAADRFAAGSPPAVSVERKGLGVTFHWRNAPAAAGASAALAERLAAQLGLELRRGRMAVELTAPGGWDKGVAVTTLCGGLSNAFFAGDDSGDLLAFEALDRLAESSGLYAVKVAVENGEASTALAQAADLRVSEPAAVLSLLSFLAVELPRC